MEQQQRNPDGKDAPQVADGEIGMWSMLLAALAGLRDEGERLRLVVSALPSLAGCVLAGGALKTEGGRWMSLTVELNGKGAGGELRDRLLPHLEGLLARARRAGWAEYTLGESPDRHPGPLSSLRELGIERVGVVPIRTVHSPLGILLLGRATDEGWGSRVEGVVGIVAEQLATGIENLRLQRRLESHSEELNRQVAERTRELDRSRTRIRVLLEITNAVVSNLTREPLFKAIAESLRRVVDLDRASLMLLEPDEEHFAVITLTDLDPDQRLSISDSLLPISESVAGSVLRSREPRVVRDLRRIERAHEDRRISEAGVLSYLSVPLVSRGRALGVLAVGSREADQYGEEDAAFLTQVAGQVALGVDNMLTYEEVDELRRRLERENRELRARARSGRDFGAIVGQSPAISELVESLAQVAPTDATVLIQGESGTGKELVAQEIHNRSSRKDGPLVKVNCAAIPRELYESEFFGHVKGAFSGAVRERDGRFAAAHGGTLFLDEVGELPLDLQGKLLRVLQDGTYQRVGEDATRSVDVRVVAASNRKLEREMREGRFREDLFYRLNVFPLQVPPLRDRREDIPLLAQHFLEEIGRSSDQQLEEIRLSELNVARLQVYDWPGNVRELRNAVERAFITRREGRLRFDLPSSSMVEGAPDGRGWHGDEHSPGVLTEAEMEERIRRNIEVALDLCGGKVYGDDGAAALLELPPTTLASRMKRLGIRG